jgi:hypothetical protein
LGSLYRRKYDAAKTVAKFSMTLRAETDLDRLREQLLAVDTSVSTASARA